MQILVFIHAFNAGGAQRRAITLARAFQEAGHDVAMAVVDETGELRHELPAGVKVHQLGSWFPHWLTGSKARATRLLGAVPGLARLIRRKRPDILLAGANHALLSCALAHRIAGDCADTQLVLRFSNTLSGDRKKRSLTRPLKIAWLRRLVARAFALIAVSDDVARDVAKRLKIRRERLHVLPNPVIDVKFYKTCCQSPDHKWLQEKNVPVVLGVGRLHAQKDFATLINAFAWLRTKQDARLIVYGEGDERKHLQKIVAASGHSDAIDFPGYHSRPWQEMAHSDVLVLSSCWEGMPGVLIEAMAAGCPVISTDCPGGSREILQDGQFGQLVPVGDAQAMAQAIENVLAASPDTYALQNAAAHYDIKAATQAYLNLFNQCNR